MELLRAEAIEHLKVRDVAIVHRLGRLQVGETSVLIVQWPRRTAGAAFEGLPVGHRYAEKDRPNLEEGAVRRRRGVG